MAIGSQQEPWSSYSAGSQLTGLRVDNQALCELRKWALQRAIECWQDMEAADLIERAAKFAKFVETGEK